MLILQQLPYFLVIYIMLVVFLALLLVGLLVRLVVLPILNEYVALSGIHLPFYLFYHLSRNMQHAL